MKGPLSAKQGKEALSPAQRGLLNMVNNAPMPLAGQESMRNAVSAAHELKGKPQGVTLESEQRQAITAQSQQANRKKLQGRQPSLKPSPNKLHPNGLPVMQRSGAQQKSIPPSQKLSSTSQNPSPNALNPNGKPVKHQQNQPKGHQH